MQAEEKGQGSVPWSVYGVYIQAAGGPLAFLLILSLFMLNVGSTAFSTWWLSYWIKQGSGVRTLPQGRLSPVAVSAVTCLLRERASSRRRKRRVWGCGTLIGGRPYA